jgi:hypothetical protein
VCVQRGVMGVEALLLQAIEYRSSDVRNVYPIGENLKLTGNSKASWCRARGRMLLRQPGGSGSYAFARITTHYAAASARGLCATILRVSVRVRMLCAVHWPQKYAMEMRASDYAYAVKPAPRKRRGVMRIRTNR